MGLKRFVCVGLIGLVLMAPAAARHRHQEGTHRSFDYYLLSLSVTSSFCALSAANAARVECLSLNQAAFEQTPLTVHGLWPNRTGASVNLQPHDCSDAPFKVAESLKDALERYMPAGAGLQRYEWHKHGTCSGLSSEAYFSTLVELGRHANETIGVALRNRHMPGERVRLSALVTAASAKDPLLGTAIIMDCRSPRGGGDALIAEIRVTLSKDFRPVPASSVGLGQNSGCPGGAGRVPDLSQ